MCPVLKSHYKGEAHAQWYIDVFYKDSSLSSIIIV